MTAILSMLAVLGTALWFYRTAGRRGLPGLAWAIAGVLVYYGGFLFWMYAILRPAMGGGFQVHGFWTGIGMDLTAIACGALCMAGFRHRVLLKKGSPPAETPF
ncbi:hypothetical protein [Methylomagnum ishizawai]|uniref:hypothetical protein n=1 Tax=Methylomagnum ishizawai TaxID=1760988 RepID=UPI001FECA4DC|nr:hypothetical protein [Methylomagnum ishizawai]